MEEDGEYAPTETWRTRDERFNMIRVGEALAQALTEGRIASAACDVFEMEPPLPTDHPLLRCPNTIVTPHIAFASRESMEMRADIAFGNLYAFLEGRHINAV